MPAGLPVYLNVQRCIKDTGKHPLRNLLAKIVNRFFSKKLYDRRFWQISKFLANFQISDFFLVNFVLVKPQQNF